MLIGVFTVQVVHYTVLQCYTLCSDLTVFRAIFRICDLSSKHQAHTSHSLCVINGVSVLTEGHIVLHLDGELVIAGQRDAVTPQRLSCFYGAWITLRLWLRNLVLIRNKH